MKKIAGVKLLPVEDVNCGKGSNSNLIVNHGGNEGSNGGSTIGQSLPST